MHDNLNRVGLKTADDFYVIAEIGINHGGDIKKAYSLIDSAARTGCHAVKFQTYITENRVSSKQSPIYGILKQCELSFDCFNELKVYSESKGLQFFSTPFDQKSIEYLISIGTEIFKIASFDVTNTDLIKTIASTEKTIIMSVGMASREEIDVSYSLLTQKSDKIILMHCVSAYPLEPTDANLNCLITLKESFNCLIGYSDHTNGIDVPLLAFAMGARVIEKHYRIDDEFECVDAPVSINEVQMKQMIEKMREIDKIQGQEKLALRPVEQTTTIHRRYS